MQGSWSIIVVGLCASLAAAQFQFFDQFFGGQQGGQQQQQGSQNVASDSNWYASTWDQGESSVYRLLSVFVISEGLICN